MSDTVVDITEPVASEQPAAPARESRPVEPGVPSSRSAWEQAYAKIFNDEPEQPTGGAEEPADRQEPRARDDAGRFASKAAEKPADGQTAPTAAAQPVETVSAPQRLSRAAQEAWIQTPDVVRAEVARMERELTQGLDKYRESATAFEQVRQFDEMARASGTTLDKALSSYVGIESLLRQDPVKGVFEVCRNLGVDPRAMAQAMLGNADPSAPVTGPTPEVVALKNEIAALKAEILGVSTQFKQRDALTTLQQFASDKPDFEALSSPIAQLMQSGMAKDLQSAYDMARRLHPELAAVKAEPAKAAPEPAHIRKASLGVTGSPSTASNAATRTNPPPAKSSRQAIEAAFAKFGIQ